MSIIYTINNICAFFVNLKAERHMIDIRELPVLYINLSNQTERSSFMQKMLNNHGFVKYKRFNAIRTPDNGYNGSFLSHIKAAWELLVSNASEYVVVMEDDIIIRDLNAINDAINKTIAEKGPFDQFIVTHPDGNNSINHPPKDSTDLLHFVIYRRERIPYIIQRGIFVYLRNGVLDRCYQSDTNFVAFHSDACSQLYNYHLSHDNNAKMHLIISDAPYDKTFDKLVSEFSSKYPHLYGRYYGFRFYYTKDEMIKENSPFSIETDTTIPYASDPNERLMNVLNYLTAQGIHTIILWNPNMTDPKIIKI
jgi:GR25 family glycosyltransferase involved in LPS biosynthesis